jgi:streptomycin 6-kinase
VPEHLAIGADLLRRMAAVGVSAERFRDLVEVAQRLAAVAAERIERLVPGAPIPVDPGLCRHAVDLLATLPGEAAHRGLAHGDLNPGNILRHDDTDAGTRRWLAIDPKPVYGDRAFDPWPLLTQIGDWTATVPDASQLAERTRLVADATGLDAARIAAWCVARGVESGLWAADHGWWTGFRGADGDLARARAWADASDLLGA